jgi:hypothetical protein
VSLLKGRTKSTLNEHRAPHYRIEIAISFLLCRVVPLCLCQATARQYEGRNGRVDTLDLDAIYAVKVARDEALILENLALQLLNRLLLAVRVRIECL